MTFLFPLGLLGLIGVPVIVIIYVLRNKFNEQTVPSTYLWILSEKFFKRRNPLSGLTGIISLILQILTVVTVSLAVSRPIFVLPNSASEYCFVLDASGSMNVQTDGETRFALAQDAIQKDINTASAGSTYTLIHVSTETTVAYERLSDKKLAVEVLKGLSCSDGEVEYTQSLATAQGYFDENPSTIVKVYTDTAFEKADNVEIINVANVNDVNYALSDVESSLLGGMLSVRANVTAFGADGQLNVELYVDGAQTHTARETLSLQAGETQPVTLSTTLETYESFRIFITNNDALATDNEYIGYNQKNESAYDILIVSETPFFWQASFDSVTDSKVDTATPDEYDVSTTAYEGYGLYVFHSYTPQTLPDAAVWLVNATGSVENAGFSTRGIVALDEPMEIVKSNSTATIAKTLLTGIDGRDIFIREYVKCSGMYTKFTTLFTYDANPMIFAGVNALGNREVVFAFDLHKANISLSIDQALLVANLLSYSCPDVLDKTAYSCGEDAHVNVIANAKNVKAVAPNGKEIY
ncbi:MAG: VWA domain-containing protein, partial [Clostridia bacterium]|nr:VWA domain-containing protein [Clostridia bacterium]